MTTLTPEQRLKAYKYALNKFETADNYDVICYWLGGFVFRELNFAVRCAELCKMFPEFAKRKPEGVKTEDRWFTSDEEGYLMRVLLILDCIEEVKGLIRK